MLDVQMQSFEYFSRVYYWKIFYDDMFHDDKLYVPSSVLLFIPYKLTLHNLEFHF